MTDLARVPSAALGETAASATAAASKAAITTRYELAMMRPRNVDTIRARLLKECERPSFARAALYKKPLGTRKDPKTGEEVEAFAEGLSIRFAEAARRTYGNTYDEAVAVFEDDAKIIYRVTAMDLETNSTTSVDVRIEKTVERRFLRKGQEPLGERRNSWGDLVYLVPATEDQIRTNVKRELAKELRDALLSLIPGDILAECEAECRRVSADEDAKDPDKARRDLIDGFFELGISPTDLAGYVGHDLAMLQPAEREHLRAIFVALRDGATTWQALIETRGGEAVDAKGKQTPQAKRVESALATAKAKIAERAKDAKGAESSGATPDAGGLVSPASAPATDKPLDAVTQSIPYGEKREDDGSVPADQEPKLEGDPK